MASGPLRPGHSVLQLFLVLEGIQVVLRQVPPAVLENEGPRRDELAGDDAVAEPRTRVAARPQAVLCTGL